MFCCIITLCCVSQNSCVISRFQASECYKHWGDIFHSFPYTNRLGILLKGLSYSIPMRVLENLQRSNKVITFNLSSIPSYIKNVVKIPLPDMTWSVKDTNTFLQHPLIYSLMTYDTQYNNREIEYVDHNYSSDDSSLWGDLPDDPQ